VIANPANIAKETSTPTCCIMNANTQGAAVEVTNRTAGLAPERINDLVRDSPVQSQSGQGLMSSSSSFSMAHSACLIPDSQLSVIKIVVTEIS
jgi:hypothetical protein